MKFVAFRFRTINCVIIPSSAPEIHLHAWPASNVLLLCRRGRRACAWVLVNTPCIPSKRMLRFTSRKRGCIGAASMWAVMPSTSHCWQIWSTTTYIWWVLKGMLHPHARSLNWWHTCHSSFWYTVEEAMCLATMVVGSSWDPVAFCWTSGLTGDTTGGLVQLDLPFKTISDWTEKAYIITLLWTWGWAGSSNHRECITSLWW